MLTAAICRWGQYFENAAARELFDFQNTESEVSRNYVRALQTVMDHGVSDMLWCIDP